MPANRHGTIRMCVEYGFQFWVLHFEAIIHCLDGDQNNEGYGNHIE